MTNQNALYDLIRRRLSGEETEPLTPYMSTPNPKPLPNVPRSFFSAEEETAPTIPTIPQESVIERLRRAYQSQPREADYEPSLLRKILGKTAAGVVSAGQGMEAGAAVGRNIVNKPYSSALEKYTRERVTPLEKELALEQGQQKLQLGGLSGQASLINAARQMLESNPEYQESLAGAKERGTLSVRAPYEEAKEGRAQTGREELESLRQSGRINLSEYNSYLDMLKQGREEDFRKALQNKDLETRERIADANRISRERISQLAREARLEAAKKGTTAFISQSEQGTAQARAENEIATISNPDLIKKLFKKDKSGFWRLSPQPQPNEEYYQEWLEAKRQIFLLQNKLLQETRTIE